ncbi:hypothetical protein G6F24_017636 [Rhizopus arrhizus]|nr:hypothetical protein G6F24_017636 [Rhizopus arrhizus]
MRHGRDDLGRDDWGVSGWQPTKLERSLDKGDTPAPLVAKREEWYLQPDAHWHGFENLGADYVLLDPIKVTLLPPGLAMDGSMGKLGIPAAVRSKFLWGRGITVEKTNLYSVLFLSCTTATRR